MTSSFAAVPSAGRHTRTFSRFQNRVRDLQDQVTGVDAALDALSLALQSPNATSNRELRRLSQLNSDQLRVHTRRLRRRHHQAALHLLYSHYIAYLRGLVFELYQVAPLTIVGKANGTLAFHEIVTLGGYDAICSKMCDRVFRQLDKSRSSQSIIKKLLEHTAIALPDDVLQRAAMYVALRHLLVHNAGHFDSDFHSRYQGLYPHCISEDGKIDISKKLVRSAIASVCELVQIVDHQLAMGNLVNAI